MAGGADADFWAHIRESNKKQAQEDIEGWSGMLETKKAFLEMAIPAHEALSELIEFLEDYPDDFVTLQAELKRVIEYTKWSIRECKMNVGWAKKRLKGSEENVHTEARPKSL